MKTIFLTVVLLSISTALVAQFKQFSIQKSDIPSLNIIQIDFREKSTLIHFQMKSLSALNFACIKEGIYVKEKETYKKFRLISSFNLPFCDVKHVFDNADQVHNFTLEFEKFPTSIGEFDIIEGADGGFNFYGIEIDTTIKARGFLDIDNFIGETPVKELNLFFKDNLPIYTYRYNGLELTVILSYEKNYGSYYQADIIIKNLTGKDFLFDPSLITCKIWKKGNVSDAKVLVYNDYMKKVKNRQFWNAAVVSMLENDAASKAGYSTSTTNSAGSGISSTSGYASGYVGNTYGRVYGTSSTYSSVYGSSTTQNYDGAVAYAAQQNANRNVANFQNQQYQIKQTLSEGYAKLNTIKNETEYQGFINISYVKADNLLLSIPLNGSLYVFAY